MDNQDPIEQKPESSQIRRRNGTIKGEEDDINVQNQPRSIDGSYTNMSGSHTKSSVVDYQEDDILYDFMKEELNSILEKSKIQATDFFGTAIKKLKEKEEALIKYYEEKLLASCEQVRESKFILNEEKKKLKNMVDVRELSLLKLVAKSACQESNAQQVLVENMALKHYQKNLKLKGFNSLKMRFQKGLYRKRKSKFKSELEDLASKYQQTIEDLEGEMEYLRTENDGLLKEKDNMVFNLKNALEKGFDILNSSVRENKTSTDSAEPIYTPEPMTTKARSYYKKDNSNSYRKKPKTQQMSSKTSDKHLSPNEERSLRSSEASPNEYRRSKRERRMHYESKNKHRKP